MSKGQNKSSDLLILMATHGPKCFYDKYTDFCVPIEVGADERDSFRYDLRDNFGDNISEKHPYYAEVTALYWIWKNVKVKYVGLYHYRRSFLLPKDEILKILDEYDYIVPSRISCNLELRYKNLFVEEDWDLMMDAIRTLYPEDYTKILAVCDNVYFYKCNIFITDRDKFCRYCEWMFPILQYVEERCDQSKHIGYQIRWAGFMAENLFTLYIAINSFNVYCSEVRKRRGVSKNYTTIENIYNIVRDNRVLYKIAGIMPPKLIDFLRNKVISEEKKRLNIK